MNVEFMKQLMEVNDIMPSDPEEWLDEHMVESKYEFDPIYNPGTSETFFNDLKPYINEVYLHTNKVYEIKQIISDALADAYKKGYRRRQ